MKRITSREAKEAENDPDAPVPDFYAISREYPLPELTGFRSKDGSGLPDEAGMNGSRADLDGNLHAGNRDQDIAALERRRQEILQRFSSLQPGMNSAQGLADPNAALMMLLSMQQQQQQQQQQQLGAAPNLATTLAALTGGMNQGALAAGNPFGFGNFGLGGMAQAQANPLAQFLSQYQQAGAAGSPFPAPAPASGLHGLPLNISEMLGQNPALAQSFANTSMQQMSGNALTGQLSALLGGNMGSTAGAAGGSANNTNSAPNPFLMQQILSGGNGLNGADFSAWLQPQSAVASTDPSGDERKTAKEQGSPPLASIQNPSGALEALQRQLSGRSTANEMSGNDPAPSAPAAAASNEQADLQKMMFESGGTLTPALLALLQKQIQSSSQVSAPAAPPAPVSAVPQASAPGSGSSVPNNLLSLFGFSSQPQMSGATTQAAQAPASQQDDGQMQRQLLSALAAAGAAGRSSNLPAPNAMNLNLDLQQLLQAQMGGMSGLSNMGSIAPSKD
jgi:hypothetical protein